MEWHGLTPEACPLPTCFLLSVKGALRSFAISLLSVTGLACPAAKAHADKCLSAKTEHCHAA